MNASIGQRKQGFVLLLSLILMATLAAIVGALAITLSGNFRALSGETNGLKTFWIAEAGTADAVKRLNNDEINLLDGESTSFQNNSFGGGSYSVSVSRSGLDISIISTGTINGLTRIVKEIQTMTNAWPTAFNYAVFGSNTNGVTLEIGQTNPATVAISGDLFYNATAGTDTVMVRNNSSVTNGLVYADVVTGGGTYTKASSNPNPVPTYPSFVSTYYTNTIATGEATASANLVLSGSSNLNLAGQTVYYKTVTIKDNATVTGPGTLVATKATTIRDSASIGSGVNVISNQAVLIRDSVIFASGGTVFSNQDINLRQTVNVTSALLAPGSGDVVEISDNATFTGIVYADRAQFINNGVLNGSVVVNRFVNNQISNNFHATFQSSYLPQTISTGFTSNESYGQKANSWQECPVPVGPPC